ncbi:MAG TPA: hypothetical protein VGH28_04585 [Polyangiaceae bacterium]|jgi:endonuclease III
MKPVAKILDTLEKTFGRVAIPKRVRAYDMLIRAQCGYPASEEACEKGLRALEASVGTAPDEILGAPKAKLVKAMRAGGIVPEVRTERLRAVAKHARDGADFRDRKTLKKLPTIGDPAADKILLFTRVQAIAAVPSNATQVPARIGIGKDLGSYAATYRSIERALDAALPKTFDARIRAHLLLKRHGQDVCKRARPRCELCPIARDCDYFKA